MIISSNNEVYSEVNLIIESLNKHGEQEISKGLSDAMCGYTAGEVLGDIGVCMERLLKNEKLLTVIKKEEEIKAILKYIKSVWH